MNCMMYYSKWAKKMKVIWSKKNLTWHVALHQDPSSPQRRAEPSQPYNGSTYMRSQAQPPCEHLNNDRSVDIFIQLTHVCCGRCGTNGFCHLKQIS